MIRANNTFLHIFIFLIGFIAGICVIFAWIKQDAGDSKLPRSFFYTVNRQLLKEFEEQSKRQQAKVTEKSLEKPVENDVRLQTKHDATSIAKTLSDSVKILCLINTAAKHIEARAIHVNATWAQRCTKHIFLSYNASFDLPYLDLGVPELRSNLWNKMRALFRWIIKNEVDNFDFFLRADDDSYFIMENLRFMLLPYNPEEPLYFGSRFKMIVKNGYMSGGAGYILTRAAVKKLVPGFEDPKICPQENGDKEDAKIGACMEKLEIPSVDTRDSLGRHRMLPFSPGDHLVEGLRSRHFQYLFYPYKSNETAVFECCANHMISFHYINKNLMYYFEFLIYHVRAIGALDDLWVKAAEAGVAEGKSLLEILKEASIDMALNSTLIS